MNKNLFKLLALMSLALILVTSSCKKDEDIVDVLVPTEKAFVGSEACMSCHQDAYDLMMTSGHPFKLNKVDGAAPTYPNLLPALTIPAVLNSWDDVTYVIGGFAWKARFVDANGYIVTGDAVQYNLVDQTWSGYHSDEAMGTKQYNCGKCHTTGWVDVAAGAVGQGGLAGMAGTFTEGGVRCEACHGEGNIHAVTKSVDDIVLDESSELCGKCHYRDEGHNILASGGFIKHHEQYDEFKTSGHSTSAAGLTCATCHVAHGSVKHGETSGLTTTGTCTNCHGTTGNHAITTNTSHHGADCVTCHMPYATKSAITTKGGILGDVQTHIFKLNPALGADMFSEDGGNTYANINLEGVPAKFACYYCHSDGNGGGGDASVKTLEDISDKATGFHTAPAKIAQK